MLKIRRPLGRLIFNMGIAIPGKTVFLIETAPWWNLRKDNLDNESYIWNNVRILAGHCFLKKKMLVLFMYLSLISSNDVLFLFSWMQVKCRFVLKPNDPGYGNLQRFAYNGIYIIGLDYLCYSVYI